MIKHSSAKASKLLSRQFYDIVRFLQDNTKHENGYVISVVNGNKQLNKDAEETDVEAID